jgi:hypothetical protein
MRLALLAIVLLVNWSHHWAVYADRASNISLTRVAQDTVDLFGYYAIVDPPSWCANIDVLHLSTINFRGDTLIHVPLWGFIRLKGRPVVDYHLVKLALTGQTFTFTTETVAGISYDFVGQFLNFPHRPPNGEVVLAGHLRKLTRGIVTKEADVRFSYFGGD